MKDFEITRTKVKPEIICFWDRRYVSIRGSSYPENTVALYEPLIEWLEELFKCTENKKLSFMFELLYFNSSSAKMISNILDMAEAAMGEDWHITVEWVCFQGNDTMEEYGEEFQEDYANLNFHLRILE